MNHDTYTLPELIVADWLGIKPWALRRSYRLEPIEEVPEDLMSDLIADAYIGHDAFDLAELHETNIQGAQP